MTGRNANTFLEQFLSSDEKLLWSGLPWRGIVFRAFHLFTIPYAIFMILAPAIAIVALRNEIIGGQQYSKIIPKMITGFGFGGFGLFFLFIQPVFDVLQRRRIVYAVTDRRVIMIGGLFSTVCHSLLLQTLNEISLDKHFGGTGTIAFGEPSRWRRLLSWQQRTGPWRLHRLERVKDPEKVLELIRAAQKAA